ncbi:expressed unknown protein [Seminavis robusta]|uniref:G-protein coupled receptors family 2 profile 2 domain-containing protein n=1 Tax=Seminavis robusta TaxID=568900 RepID=A0A9N8E9B6_9STRA|nr:expressed unknown protein [Seminavis robusta]|eukprot:Sro815_g206520.1 n/a (702) ;mRNA; f:28728-30833
METSGWMQNDARMLVDFDDQFLATQDASLLALNSSSSYTGSGMANTTEDEAYYEAGKVALILPRLTAVISLFAIVCVAIEAWKDLAATKKNRGGVQSTTRKSASTITHIQLFYQIPLFCQAVAFALGSTAAPNGEVWGAIGNTATCTAQGFLFQFGVHAAIGWDATLSATYLMIVRYNVAEFRLQAWERYYHIVIWPCTLAICIYPLVRGMYNFNHSFCWLESYPNDCVGDECIRGEGAALWQNMASFLMMIQLVYSISVMAALYWSIRGLENWNRRYGSSNFESPSSDEAAVSRRNSRAVGIQGMMYASGMVTTSLPIIIYTLLGNMAGVWSAGFFVFANSVVPLIGYVNFLIFMRKRAECKTRYAKLLRKAHSWLFDYELLCNCHLQCLPVHAGEVNDTAPSTLPRGNPCSDSGPPVQPQMQPQIEPLHATEDKQSDASEGASGRSEGIWISFQRTSQRISQWISQLGESQYSSECDRFDNPPSRPVRFKSEAANPPTMPVRVISEVTDVDAGKSGRLNSGEATPSIPVRLESCTLRAGSEGLLVERQCDASPAKPPRFASEIDDVEQDVEGKTLDVSPAKPLRFVSECDVAEHGESTRTLDLSPAKPLRLASQCGVKEQHEGTGNIDSTPTNPLRWTSEIDVPEQDDFTRTSNVSPMKPLRFVSECDFPDPQHDSVGSLDMPPSNPRRFESECEVSEL